MSKTSTARVRDIPPATPQDRARAERREKLLQFFAAPPPEVLAAAEAVGRARKHYGDDTDGELADLEAGRHPMKG